MHLSCRDKNIDALTTLEIVCFEKINFCLPRCLFLTTKDLLKNITFEGGDDH
jgi:hypothetical protein